MRSWAVRTLRGSCPDSAPGCCCCCETWWLFMGTKVFLLWRGSFSAEDQLGGSRRTSGRACVGTGLSRSWGHREPLRGPSGGIHPMFISFRSLSSLQASFECLPTQSLPYPCSCHQPSPIPGTAVLLRPAAVCTVGLYPRFRCKPHHFLTDKEENGHRPGPWTTRGPAPLGHILLEG